MVSPQALRVRVTNELLVEEADESRLVRLDPEGRWITARFDRATFRRAWSGSVFTRHGNHSVELPEEDAARVHERVRALVTVWGNEVASGRRVVESHGREATSEELVTWFASASSWTLDRWREERTHEAHAYPEPIPVLPPDRARDLVVLPAVGCPHGRCAFCSLHGEERFRVFGDEEFLDRLRHLKRWMGGALRSRSGVFLGSASALSLPRERLVRVLEHVREELGSFREGIAAFHDPDHAPEHTRETLAELEHAGLRHVTIGLESGAPEIREALGKRGNLERVRAAVLRQRGAGLRTALTVLVGAGGESKRERHAAATAAFLNSLELGSGDRVFVSPWEGSLEPGELEREQRRLRDVLRASTEALVAPYALDRFAHLA